MEENVIYNVMYKGEEGNKKYIIPGVISFTTYKKAEEWCDKRIDARIEKGNFYCRSTMGVWPEDVVETDEDGNILHIAVGAINDFRCEDENGDTIWYVIYAKKLN